MRESPQARRKRRQRLQQPTTAAIKQPRTVYRFKQGFNWQGVPSEPYKLSASQPGEFRGATRRVLIGARGEQVAFHVRYFELAPGGYTSLERHRHTHAIVVLRGRGAVRIGRKLHRLRPFDAVYIGPHRPHQLIASRRAPLGFLCVVDAQRDRPHTLPSPARSRARYPRAGKQAVNRPPLAGATI